MTLFLQDILRQPAELQRTIDFASGPGQSRFSEAAKAIRGDGGLLNAKASTSDSNNEK